jgi:tol-pal system protein YbgF
VVKEMSNSMKSCFVAVLLMGTATFSPVQAQSADDVNVRLNQMEEQMRTLVGQVEELTYNMKQLQAQIGAPKKLGAAEPMKLKTLSQQPVVAEQGVEQIQDNNTLSTQDVAATAITSEQPVALRKAPGPKILGTMSGTAAAAVPNDGGFQGQVLVPPGGEDAQPATQDNGAAAATDDSAATQDSIETVSLAPETPEALYERSNESLLRRQFGDAEQGFRGFLEKYPDHNLAGSAQYWLGETFFAQGDYRQAAQNFLSGYKDYPKSRRAPDSLLKLGMSLNKLGQTQQACASFGAIGGQFPNAVDAKKRAQAEFKRAGC